LNSEQVDDLTLAQIEKKRKQAYNRLEQRQERVKQLSDVSDKMQKQRANLQENMSRKRKPDAEPSKGKYSSKRRKK